MCFCMLESQSLKMLVERKTWCNPEQSWSVPAGIRQQILCELGDLDCKGKRQLTRTETLEESLVEVPVDTGQGPFSFLQRTTCEIQVYC